VTRSLLIDRNVIGMIHSSVTFLVRFFSISK
jgi:hypothetical protein